jgi:AcrR family transcriptional regulator
LTVDQILQGAAQVFAQHGYTRTTTNLIAKRTGISIGSLYQYFPNKDAILVDLFRRHVRESTELMVGIINQALADKRPLDLLLEELVEAVLDLHLAAPGLMRVLLNDAPRADDLVELVDRGEDELADMVQTLLAQHAALQPRHAAHAAYILVHLLEGLCHEFALHPPRDMDAATFVAELVALIRGYLSQPCGEGGVSR